MSERTYFCPNIQCTNYRHGGSIAGTPLICVLCGTAAAVKESESESEHKDAVEMDEPPF